jgi:hypothetical protein
MTHVKRYQILTKLALSDRHEISFTSDLVVTETGLMKLCLGNNTQGAAAATANKFFFFLVVIQTAAVDAAGGSTENDCSSKRKRKVRATSPRSIRGALSGAVRTVAALALRHAGCACLVAEFPVQTVR